MRPAARVAAPLVWAGLKLGRIIPSFTQPNQLDLNGIANNPTIIEEYKSDKYVHGRISLRTCKYSNKTTTRFSFIIHIENF